MATLKEYIDFSIEEHKSLLKRINKNQIIYTTRVSNEVNKYFINSIYDFQTLYKFKRTSIFE